MFGRSAFGRMAFGHVVPETSDVYSLYGDQAADIAIVQSDGGSYFGSTLFTDQGDVALGRGAFGRFAFGHTLPTTASGVVLEANARDIAVAGEASGIGAVAPLDRIDHAYTAETANVSVRFAPQPKSIVVQGANANLLVDPTIDGIQIAIQAHGSPGVVGGSASSEFVLGGEDLAARVGLKPISAAIVSHGEANERVVLTGAAAELVVEPSVNNTVTRLRISPRDIAFNGAASLGVRAVANEASIVVHPESSDQRIGTTIGSVQIAIEHSDLRSGVRAIPGELSILGKDWSFGRAAFGRSADLAQFHVPTGTIALQRIDGNSLISVQLKHAQIAIDPIDGDASVIVDPIAAFIALQTSPIPMRPHVTVAYFD